ncbi:urease accessory protein [Stenotrophobium rhamnosiphilum]|uniref:Urease accessory protein UreD n=2 Tax=Stenotrophobium rhamnosiphilum TaxID=2029166 RepID=A0A2T5MGS5_9GAMM|nr:urease accessory protein [Stenotrophobium rhamnosiphilum]
MIARAQRVHGAARIAFKAEEGVTRLADLYQHAPCRFLFPHVEPDEPAQAVLLTTSGGLTGGDRLAVEIEARVNTCVTVTTQAAEKLYKAADGEEDVRVDIRYRVGENAWAEWLAQETILFDRARLRRSFTADLAPGARLLALESVVFGRTAMNERFDHGLLHDAWRIRRNGRLIWADALHLEGDVAQQRALPFGFGNACITATLLYVGDDAANHLEVVRELLEPDKDLGAATCMDGLLIVRFLADDATRLRPPLMRIAGGLRNLATGMRPHLPRVWSC